MANSSMAIVHKYDGLTAVKGDHRPPQAPSQQQPQPRLFVKSEQRELPLNAQLQHQQQLKEPEFVKSIKDLGNLSAAIETFMCRYDELQKHLNFIQSAIVSRSSKLTSQHQPPPLQQKIQANTAIAPKAAPIVSKNEKQPETVTRTTEPVTKAPETAKKKTSTTTTSDATAVAGKSELRSLCEMMCGKGLRRYIITNRANIPKLREEVPRALKLAPKPAKLVLDCIGRFYLQGIKAFSKDSPMIPAREASVLCLELFLLMIDGNDVAMDTFVKREAEQAAVSWYKRLVSEGGLRRASRIDARGLLFLVSCYGIPNVFRNQDIWDLVLASDSKQIVEALRKSRVLAARVSDIIERMMKSGMRIEAVDMASTFGVEDKFPMHKILSSFLHEARESLKDGRKHANNLPIILQEANIKYLDALKYVMKFLEDRKLDPTNILPDWQIKENIIELEKDIADLNKNIEDKTLKRKAENIHSSNNHVSQETKHQRFSGNGSSLITPDIGRHEQRVVAYADGQILYDGATRLNLSNGGYSVPLNNHPAAPYGSRMHSLPENIVGTVAGGRSVTRTPGVGLSSVYGASSAGVGSSAAYDSPPTGSSTGVHRDMLVDRSGQMMGNQGPNYGWLGYGDAALNDGSLGQTFIRQPASCFYGSSLSTERFGLPNSSPAAAANRSSASDIYGFVDQT